MKTLKNSEPAFRAPRVSKGSPPLPECLTTFNGAVAAILNVNQDRGEPHNSSPPTPPDMRVRIRRFGGLSNQRTVNLGIPSESK